MNIYVDEVFKYRSVHLARPKKKKFHPQALIPTGAGDCGEETWDSPPRRTESVPGVSGDDKRPVARAANGEEGVAAAVTDDDDDRGLDASDTGDVGYCPRKVGYNAVAAAAAVGDEKSRRDSVYTPLPPPPDACEEAP